MKIIYFIFSLSFIIDIFCDYDDAIEYSFESGVTQTFSIKKNTTYYAHIESVQGNNIKIEVAMDYSSHKASPFTTLEIKEVYGFGYNYRFQDAKFSEKKKNNQLIITIKCQMTALFGRYIGLIFVSSCDISNLQIKITKSGFSTFGSPLILAHIIIFSPIIIIVICLISIVVCCPEECKVRPKPKPLSELSAPIQPPNETNEIYSINEALQNNPSTL